MNSADVLSYPGNTRPAILRRMAEALRTAGNDVTDMEAVVATTSIPVKRIAEEFGDMNGLLLALAEHVAASMLEPLARQPTTASFEAQLIEYASRVADAYSSYLRGLYRIALSDAVRHGSAGRDFYQRGPGLMAAGLARFFESAQRAGVIHHADCQLLASHFMALLRDELDLTASNPRSEKGDVSRALSLFYAGIRTGESDAIIDP